MIFSVLMLLIIGSILLIVPKYKSLAHGEAQIEAKWTQLEAQRQHRHDIILNLVENIKGYDIEERELLLGMESNNELTARVVAVIENDPGLKRQESVKKLLVELQEVEKAIVTTQRSYNEVVRGYNQHVHSFPGHLMAGTFGFEQYDFEEAVVNLVR